MAKGFFKESIITSKREPSNIPKCGACGLHKGCLSPKMGPTGEGKKKILIIAEAPGEEEDRQGTQLIGKCGELLREHLRSLKINLDKDCRKTNAIICHPPKNETPSPEKIEACRPNILKEIKSFQPDIILLLGACAVSSVIGCEWTDDIKPLNKWVGWHIPSRKFNAWLCPTYHPAYLDREEDPILEKIFHAHLEAALQLKGKPYEEIPDEEKEIEILSEEDAVSRMEGYKKAGGTIAFDYETTGLKPDSDKQEIVSCSICHNGKETIAFLMTDATTEALIPILKTGRIKKIASNMKFEERWTMAKMGMKVKGWWWDTMLSAHILDNRKRITSIKFQSYIRFGVVDYNQHVKSYFEAPSANELNRIRELDEDDLLLYNGLDSLLEYRVAVQQMREMGYPFKGE